ncbi:hypothetical protein P4S95_16180 [Aneurinibacillus aneurinilyticus]|uniref:hypothetical protein n=1 Tax=Aneurinibacillus aneurinilyticus TaxID=1391 RepID=UPI001F0E953E|nr:hypothetical protein [Aneurinibacillus aneurinilyticus]MED0671716.1 hypothetical protein [Aneurinibacillus aneurinilyticus]
MKPPSINKYASTTHCCPVAERPRSALIADNATFTMELSMTTINAQTQATVEATHAGTPGCSNDVEPTVAAAGDAEFISFTSCNNLRLNRRFSLIIIQ